MASDYICESSRLVDYSLSCSHYDRGWIQRLVSPIKQCGCQRSFSISDATTNQALSTKTDIASKEGKHLGPVVSKLQFDKIQALIQAGIDENATLITGGTGKPEGLETGYFIKPTIFADVNNQMTIAQTEIFGPVLEDTSL